MAYTSYGFQEAPSLTNENAYQIDTRNARNGNSRHNDQVTFEDLGIPRVVAVRPTIIGNVRTPQSLNTLDWFLLIGGLLAILITFGLAINRFIILPPQSPDYMFTILLLFNAVFSALYIINAVFKEQAFEAIAYALTSVVVIIYVAINFAQEVDSPSKYVFRMVRLILTLILGCVMGLTAIIIAFQQLRSGSLIFRTVGADSTIQAMCRTLFTTITLMHFDIQILGSFIILSIEHGISSLTLEEILCLTIGFPWLLAWAVLAYFAVRFESNYFFTISMTLSPGHFAYVIYSIVKTNLGKETSVAAYCRYAAGGLGLLIHSLLLVHLVLCHRNFGRGLKQKVFPSRRTENSENRILPH